MNNKELIIKELLSKIEIERIFHFSYRFCNRAEDQLLIVYNSKINVSAKSLEPIVEMILSKEKGISFSTISSGELKSYMLQGHPYYNTVCIIKNEIYCNGLKQLPKINFDSLKKILPEAIQKYKSDYNKGIMFLDGVKFYKERGNINQAAFMLHQATEISLRGLEISLFKKNRPSHCIRDHIKVLSRFIPEMKELLDLNDENTKRLIILLDKAYVAVRYESYFITEDDLDVLQNMLEPVLCACDEFFNVFIADFAQITEMCSTENLVSQKDQKKIDINVIDQLKTQISNLLNAIQKELKVVKCILLGVATQFQKNAVLDVKEKDYVTDQTHCYILCIIENGSAGVSHSFSFDNLRSTLLVHDENFVKNELEKKSRFFINTFLNGHILYDAKENENMTITSEIDWLRGYESANQMWTYNFIHNASTMLETAKYIATSGNQGGIGTITLLLSQCLEQIIKTYIYIHTGYKVNRHNLSFLIELSGIISNEVPNILQKKTENEKRQIIGLVNCINDLRYKETVRLKPIDIQNIVEKCNDVLKFTALKCESELNRIKSHSI